MAKAPQQNLSKLPRWAQNRIAKLEADLTYYKDKAYAAALGDAGSPVVVHQYGEGDDIGLPEETIRFFPDPKDRRRYIDVRRQPFGVEVRSNPLLGIRPSSSNSVCLVLEDDMPRETP